jgi:hypothetical protein
MASSPRAAPSVRLSGPPSEQEPLLQHASVPDALEQPQELPVEEVSQPKGGDVLTLKLPSVMYSWFAVGVNTASIGVSGSP